MADAELNWATAKVKDGKLTVAVEGEIASGWKDSFEMTVRLLPGGDWGKVAVKKQTVRVSGVVPGEEERLRHHLESIVEQANAAVRPPEPEAGGGNDGGSDRDSPDAKMTEAFRAFAEDPEAETPAK
ncbi:MAG TPA: hypothetical protein VG186_18705 [Solirubrobacteraceae bacterium]|jgi:hypothetical protein|nr:hypothetical protein [Solirubrobacteraceae bacterium]